MSIVMGLDIGGANTKVCWLEMESGRIVRGKGDSVYHEVWRDPEGLRGILENVKDSWEMKAGQTLQGVALTMTAELCDIFKSKAEGVLTILRLVEQAFPDVPIYVWTTRGVFDSPSQMRERPLDAAAANWLASATALAQSPFVKYEATLLVDMGSTTTDILPLVRGKVVVQGRTDLERLLYGELVYTGVLRTQIQSIVDSVYVEGMPCKVTSEYFSITADVYRLLGAIEEEDYAVATPDGRERDLTACAQRLTRVIATEPEVLGWKGVNALARFIQEKQIQQVLEGIWQLLSKREQPWPSRLIMASQGSFLLKEVARRLGLEAIPWWECLPGTKEGYNLTACSVAWLLANQLAMNKKPFRTIPALDLKDGAVVHGIRGEREKYQPIESVLSSSTDFSSVVNGFVQQLGLREFYVADLDAIMSSMKKDHLPFIAQKNAEKVNSLAPLSFMVDAGVCGVDDVGKVLAAGVDNVIIGTETLPSLEMLQDIINCYGAEPLVVSVDIKDTKIMSAALELTRLTPPQALRELKKLGIQKFILLELSNVGTGVGLNKKLIKECLAVLNAQPQESIASLILGGGVSGYEDLHWLAQNGVAGAIVATALHDGRLTRKKLSRLN